MERYDHCFRQIMTLRRQQQQQKSAGRCFIFIQILEKIAVDCKDGFLSSQITRSVSIASFDRGNHHCVG